MTLTQYMCGSTNDFGANHLANVSFSDTVAEYMDDSMVTTDSDHSSAQTYRSKQDGVSTSIPPKNGGQKQKS